MIRPFRLHAVNGRTYEAVQFSSGQICISHPDDPDFPNLSFSLYGDIAYPLRTCPVLRQARVEFEDQETS
ncbi:hypothetical protein [Streptomyces sp. NPDC005732]|uniref:hypothetical protein n=1 Tax=Streptomyces sp. NPDC005732 TaxID=3157057 RepID=UPI00340D6162